MITQHQKGLKARKAMMIISLLIAFIPCLRAQNVLSLEREKEIKESGRYYWGECAAFNADEAKSGAYHYLSKEIMDGALQSLGREEKLKALETMNVNFDNLQQDGKIVLAWIAKESVFVTTKKPIVQTPSPTPIQSAPDPQPVVQPDPVPQPIEKPAHELVVVPVSPAKPVETENPVLQKLISCKTQGEVNRVVQEYGLITSENPHGFAKPEKCIIAVFNEDGALVVLLDAGGSSRTDLLSGKTIQNPEQQYRDSEFVLWYLLQK
jgi:hypothetical protein